MSGIEDAAILLLGIGEEHAAEVLKHLEPGQVQKVGKAMTGLASVSQEKVHKVMQSFVSFSYNQAELGDDRGSSVLNQIIANTEENGLNSLKCLDAQSVSELIINEHPQVIATILMYLDSEQAAEIIPYLPASTHVDILVRMSTIQSIKPQALQELGKVINSQLIGKKQAKTENIEGIKCVAGILNYLDPLIEKNVLADIKKQDPEMCNSIYILLKKTRHECVNKF